MLLAGLMAHTAPGVDPELREDLMDVMDRLSRNAKVVQPRVRHRFQSDLVGLTVSRQQLVSDGSGLHFVFDDENARPVQLALGAVYAAASLPQQARDTVFETFQSALVWSRPVDSSFISFVMGGLANGVSAEFALLEAWHDPISWAMKILEIEADAADDVPSKRIVQRKFRSLLRAAHPDHGGQDAAAAARIAELSEARRILLAT